MQTDDLAMLEEAAKSDCDGIRFGPEFCERKIPSIDVLNKSCGIAEDESKEFIYVTPKV